MRISDWSSDVCSSDLPSLHRTCARCRNINLLPIDYAFLPRLRGRLTLRRLTLRKETLGFRRAGFSPALSLLMSAFALPIPPAAFSIHLNRLTERSSTAHTEVCTPSFVLPLRPVKSSVQTDSTSRLLPFL